MASLALSRKGGSMSRGFSCFLSPSRGAAATRGLSLLAGFRLVRPQPQRVRSLPAGVPWPVHFWSQVSAPLKGTCRPVLFPRSCLTLRMLASLSSRYVEPPLSISRLRAEVRVLKFLVRWSSFWRLEGKTSSAPLVFLSFHGPDTRTGFANFLYKGLVAAGVSVFWDDDDLPFGKPIIEELTKAIRPCEILIPIISGQYVESRSCNVELTEMMNCHREHGSRVYAIYYKVNPADVGCQSGKFGEDLRKHEMRYGLEVRRWIEALTAVAKLKGWTLQDIAEGQEANLVEMVVLKVLSDQKRILIGQLPPILRLVFEERRECEWQVFLVFQGLDIERGLAGHLKASLCNAGIRVFSNDDPSLIGKDIAHENRNAIKKSKICIAIVDENFYSSSSCLEALVQMFEYEKMVIPIFLVEPSQLWHVSLVQQDKDLEGRSEQWEQALKKLASNRGFVPKNIANGKQFKLVELVVKKVSSLLNNL